MFDAQTAPQSEGHFKNSRLPLLALRTLSREFGMRGSPVLWSKQGGVQSAVELKSLRREANAEGAYKEEDLQWLIDECPGVLPINEFLPRVRNVWSLGREIPVDLGGSQGFIDNLLVTDTGHLVVVETKLWRNPEALRQVVTQIIHYAMGLQAAELDSVVRKGDKRSKNQLGVTESVAQRVNELDEGLLGFEDQLDDHLRKGEMLLLIVGDRTPRWTPQNRPCVDGSKPAIWLRSRRGFISDSD